MDELFATVTPLQIAVITFSVMGAIELIKRLCSRDYETSVIIIAAFLVGTLMSLPTGAVWYVGGIIGLSATGLFSFVQNIGKRANVVGPTGPMGPPGPQGIAGESASILDEDEL